MASLHDGTLVPFDPVTFVAHAFKHVPGAILSLAVASHSTCTNEAGEWVLHQSRGDVTLVQGDVTVFPVGVTLVQVPTSPSPHSTR